MPQVSGWEVIEAIRQRAPAMPVVLITALHDPTIIQRAREWRVPVLTKPFRLETLKATVVEALYATTGQT
jgi:CheY-like chemotaxis protein